MKQKTEINTVNPILPNKNLGNTKSNMVSTVKFHTTRLNRTQPNAVGGYTVKPTVPYSVRHMKSTDRPLIQPELRAR